MLRIAHASCRSHTRLSLFRQLRSVPRPPSHRIGWNQDVLRKIMPFTAELISDRGLLFDNIAVGYCHQRPPSDIDATTGVGKRRFEDSWLEMILPLSDHKGLREAVVRIDEKNLRYGKLFEILDALAADVSYRHSGGLIDEIKPLSIVTASVDGFNAFGFINIFHDLKLQGYLGYVGTSSMEVLIDIISVDGEGNDTIVGNTQFIMVARDMVNNKSTPIHGLILEDTGMKERYLIGKERASQRKASSKESLSIAPPTVDEVQIIHNLFIKYKNQIACEADLKTIEESIQLSALKVKWMENTTQKCLQLMHPQDRNIHGKIFGGFLMRVALELSWATSLLFLGNNYPVFLSADNIQFVRPVSIGDIIDFTGRVIYSEKDKFIVEVTAEEINTLTNTRTETNKLIYVYQASSSPESRIADNVAASVKSVFAPVIVPKQYEEFVVYLKGKRALDHYMDGIARS